MRSFGQWLRRLFGGEAPQPALPQERTLLSGSQALVLTEAAVSDVACSLAGDHPTPTSLRHTEAPGANGVLAAAAGLALTGQRVAAYLPAERLCEARAQLAACAERSLPLVVHVGPGDLAHEGSATLADTGALVLTASSGQEALDLALVARWVAERALAPVVVIRDQETVEELAVPSAELIGSYLGAPDEQIPSPTPAQRALFGETRRRMMRWFDPAHPVATGGPLGAREGALAAVGRSLLFREPYAELLTQACAELAALTGRPLGALHEHRLADAQGVVVAQGAAVATACAVADLLRTKNWKVGVLGIRWRGPFPSTEVACALRSASRVTVLERSVEAPGPDAPLLRELRACLAGLDKQYCSAGWAGQLPGASELGALYRNMQAGARMKPWLRLGLDAPSSSSFPRREVLLQDVLGQHPRLEQVAVSTSSSADTRPGGSRTVALIGGDLPADAFPALAAAVQEEDAAATVRGTWFRAAPTVWSGQVVRSPAPAPFDVATPVDVLLLASLSLPAGVEPFRNVGPGSAVAISSAWDAAETWRRIPSPWRARIRSQELNLFRVAPGFRSLLSGCRLLDDSQPGEPLERIAWRELPAPPLAERELPQFVQRLARIRPTHDCVSRFWGEVVQPRQEEGVGAVDPFLAAAVVPACTTAFADVSAAREQLPVLDPAACTACGRCWSACPDSAIGVSALPPLALLDAAAEAGGASGDAAQALQRSHKHLATRVAGQLAQGESLSDELLQGSFEWLLEKMKPSDEERSGYSAAFQATRAELARLPFVVSEPLFRGPEQAAKGSGALLALAVDPRACQGCGVCVEVCPDDALRLVPETSEAQETARGRWRAWERLPDTPGDVLARASEALGPLAGLLLSRHCGQALVGGGGSEPGSGARLALRLVVAATEYHAQRRVGGVLRELEQQATQLKERARAVLSEGLAGTEPGVLGKALEELSGRRVGIGALGEQLSGLGERVNLDRDGALRLTRALQSVEETRWRLSEGESGLGWARFGLVLTREVGAWAATFPDNPVFAPLVVELSADGVELARGAVEGMLRNYLVVVRSRRRAALLLSAPRDLPARLEELETLTWEDLSDEERVDCPPLLLVGDDEALCERGLGALSRLLASDRPVKVVLLDGLAVLERASPALIAMAHRRAYVLASSLAQPDHLAEGLEQALAYPGPALIHLHAPSPREHGFSPAETVRRAALAVSSRAHPLLRYDPRSAGLFGGRASLEGNPEPEAGWVQVEGSDYTLADWARGEERFQTHFAPEPDPALARACQARLEEWTVLQELCGVKNPFVERIEAELRAELEATSRQELEAAKADLERRIEELKANQEQEMAARLRERLLSIAAQRADLEER